MRASSRVSLRGGSAGVAAVPWLFVAAFGCATQSDIAKTASSHDFDATAAPTADSVAASTGGARGTGGRPARRDASLDSRASSGASSATDADRSDAPLCLPSAGCTKQDGGISYTFTRNGCLARPAIDCSGANAAVDRANQIAQTCSATTNQSCLERIIARFDTNGCVVFVDPGKNDVESAYFACVVGQITAERWPCAAGTPEAFACQFN